MQMSCRLCQRRSSETALIHICKLRVTALYMSAGRPAATLTFVCLLLQVAGFRLSRCGHQVPTLTSTPGKVLAVGINGEESTLLYLVIATLNSYECSNPVEKFHRPVKTIHW